MKLCAKVTLHAISAIPELQQYPWNLNLIKNVEDTIVFLIRKVFIYESFSMAFYKQEMRGHFRRETANENDHFKETKTLISNSHLIRQRLQGYRGKSDIAIFAWRVTWIYAYSFLKFCFTYCLVCLGGLYRERNGLRPSPGVLLARSKVGK